MEGGFRFTDRAARERAEESLAPAAVRSAAGGRPDGDGPRRGLRAHPGRAVG